MLQVWLTAREALAAMTRQLMLPHLGAG